jgi:hypothetical protein
MRYSYLEREVPTGFKEDHDDVNETDILGFTDDDIEFQVHNIEEMIHNIERHGDDDHYSNGELIKYKKMIKDSNKPFYHGCATQYMRPFAMVKLFPFKASNGWSDYSFKDLLMLLKDMLPKDNVVPEIIYEVKQIIYLFGWRWKKSMCARMIAFYIMCLSTKTLINTLFGDSTNSIIEKSVVMTRTATETE